ncbi:cysteinyl-tRNA synthetase [Mesoplasma entomophilum]|uniref:Cysteine--tRNA ligase n=1 Tax=Mesoplasma entomophilum TaxID=2149 RepID=A0A3S5XZG3_9MOLU|nr:cysteine--tRNA ligase [Mesoplasma entomophilum]ATQ35250.1 cysteine--tRNA ligase [Mesoplasma entomophilum]ATZ19198.1 cysteinyl-tRNA synthetase [Mesoplasma entomophilum]
MKLFDTLTQEHKKINKKSINIYSCGPTIYDYIHIGNARPIILMDTLIRFLESNDVKVNFLQNITDIDDKIIEKALVENKTEKEITDKYLAAFLENLNKLNIRMPDKLIPISEKINEMNFFISELVKAEAAYDVEGDVYFDIQKFAKEYGKLSNKKIDDLISGNRVEIDNKKMNPLDFNVWKKTNKGILFDSSFGKGRPGWHTECALLIDEYFKGQTIDIHSGGIDLQFPHHENERIQFIAKNNKELADIWMHNGHLTIDGEKMSKSLGNVMTLANFLNQYNSDILRWIFLSTYYRQPINISDDIIDQANKFIQKINNLSKKIKQIIITEQIDMTNILDENILKEFKKHMLDDLNTSRVLTLIEEIIKEINKLILTKEFEKFALKINSLNYILKTLGLSVNINTIISQDEKEIFWSWKRAVSEKDFEKADEIRKVLISKGVL